MNTENQPEIIMTADKKSLEVVLKDGKNPHEIRTLKLLRQVFENYSVPIFTKRVYIEENSRPHSHPVLTLNTRQDDQCGILQTFIHEQFHWYATGHPQYAETIAYLKQRYQDNNECNVSGKDPNSFWEHIIVCMNTRLWLEEQLSDKEVQEVYAAWQPYPQTEKLIVDRRDAILKDLKQFSMVYNLETPETESVEHTHSPKLKDRLRTWFVHHAHSPYAIWVLGIVSFAESTFFPIPVDVLLAPLVVIRPKRWVWWALQTTIWSVVGGIAGYFIGLWLWDIAGHQIIELFHAEEQFNNVVAAFDKNTFWTIFTAAFTPIPYKIFTISAGVAKVSLAPFIIASFLGRGLRYFMEAAILRFFGEAVARTFYRFFNIIMVLLVLIIVVAAIWIL